VRFSLTDRLRAPLKIHFGGQANLFDSGQRQAKAALASTKANLPSLPECKNLHLAAQKQLLELPLSNSLFTSLVRVFILLPVEHKEVNPSSGLKNNPPTALRDLLMTSAEGRVLLIGIGLTLGYIFWLAFQLFTDPDGFQTLLGMTATEVVFGRIACMGFGYSMGFSHLRVVMISMLLETILVLVFYPLFVFIWQQLLQIKWLKRLSDRTYTAAQRNKDKVRKYGVIGLFMFVWLPFWMTGPVVGCMIGFLLGLRVWINLVTVLAGTYVAILGWAYLLHELHRQTLSYSSYAIVIMAAIIAAVVLAWTCRQRFRRHNQQRQ
jgi:uncharacterized membrane protein